MGADWIKMRHGLSDEPEVIGIASITGLDEDSVVGKLFRFWSWGDSHTTDGHAPSVTRAWLDRYVGATGFAQAMIDMGWLTETERGLSIPKFDRHISKSAKARALAAERARKTRGCERDERNGASVTKSAPRERERERKDVSDDTSRRAATTTEMQAVVDDWNLLGITNCSKLTNSRRNALRLRLGDQGWRDSWRLAIDRVRGSPFCHGQSDSGWKADFDWFIRPDTVTKLLEGKYDGKPRSGAGRSQRSLSDANDEAFREVFGDHE